MQRIAAVLHEPEGNWGLYSVTMTDGKTQWNAHVTRDEYDRRRNLEKIHDAVRELWVHSSGSSGWKRPTWEKVWEPLEEAISEMESSRYRDGLADRAEADAGASL